LAFGLAGRAAHQGCSTFCCAGTGDGTGAAVAFDAANAAVTAAPALMNSRRPSLDSGKGAWDFFIFVLLKIRRASLNLLPKDLPASFRGIKLAALHTAGDTSKLSADRDIRFG
jgi:hypothetical protein